ncbi:DNA cytosine methyltransferase [Sodaliphilus sp.]|uniref:DNA cytosine methyltransferase n=1 Tax=Sodaliphilus sp. TaxID=2815818 RepID=UPI00388E7237
MRVVDLFCGCGGLSLGFEKAGMDIVAAFDNWQDALYVYRNNFNHPAIHADLMDIEASIHQIRPYNPDMIIGGPPCQDFSSAGKRNEDNGRGDLTVAFAKIIAELRPQWFVMENVERILKTQKLVDALRIFHSAGYGTSYTVLNAALCGVPQKRKRFVMIGKLGAENDFMQEIIRENLSDHEMSVAEYFGDKLDIQYYYRHPRSYVRRGIFSTAEPSATIRGVNRPMPQGYQLHPGDPVDSLEGIRPLTTHERSMIQTFPEDFNFEGTKTNIEQMIGNAVPVNLGYFVADAILRYSGEKRKEYKRIGIRQLNLYDLFKQFELEPITQNFTVREDVEIEYVTPDRKTRLPIDLTKNILICNVKKDNWEQYLDGTAKIYYTGKRFPTTIALNKLYYFMPYLSGKGIRDLYFIKIARLGYRKEAQENEDKNDLRLVFEIERVAQLFDDYQKVKLEIWRTFTDTTMEKILNIQRK